MFKGNMGKVLLAAIVGYCILGQLAFGALAMFLIPGGEQK